MSLTDADLFLAEIAAAFVDAGREVQVDAAARTLDVSTDAAPITSPTTAAPSDLPTGTSAASGSSDAPGSSSTSGSSGSSGSSDSSDSSDDGARARPPARVLVVLHPLSRAVTLYATHPARVPGDAVARVRELAARVSADEAVVTLELDSASHVVSVRHALALGAAHPDDDTLRDLVTAALGEVEDGLARLTPAVESVLAGTDPTSAAATARTSTLPTP